MVYFAKREKASFGSGKCVFSELPRGGARRSPSVPQRIEQLLNPGSFREVGSLTSSVSYSDDANPLILDFVPSNNLIGQVLAVSSCPTVD